MNGISGESVTIPAGEVCRNQQVGIVVCGRSLQLSAVRVCENGESGIVGTSRNSSNRLVTSLNTRASTFSAAAEAEQGLSPTIFGSKVQSNGGDGIRFEGGMPFRIQGNNILGNAGLGINNLDRSVVLDARENWWGDPSGPAGDGPGSGDGVSGNVDSTNFLVSPLSLVSSTLDDEGQPVSYDVSVTNLGAAQANNVTLTFDVPDGLEIRSVFSPQGSCDVDQAVGRIDCDLEDFPEGWVAIVGIEAIADSAGAFTSTAAVTASEIDPESSNNTAMIDTAVVAAEAAFDFGDAPNDGAGPLPDYPTRLDQDGARHLVEIGFRLGPTLDIELDGQPSDAAEGDDVNDRNDEDGVALPDKLVGGTTISVPIQITNFVGRARLDAWIDFNRDGVWDDSPESVELIFSDTVDANTTMISLSVGPGAESGATYARFRLSRSDTRLGATGPAGAGEVEDYRVLVEIAGWQNLTQPLDVNTDGQVVPFDVLFIFDPLNNPVFSDPETGKLRPLDGNAPPPFLDVNGDGFATPIDALVIINVLNSLSGEGETVMNNFRLPVSSVVFAPPATSNDSGQWSATETTDPIMGSPLRGKTLDPVIGAVPQSVRPVTPRESLFGTADDDQLAWENVELDSLLEALTTLD